MNKTQDLFRFMWLSRPLMQRVEEMVRDGLEGTGLTVRMRAVLEILAAKGALPVPDIGRELHIGRQYVQVMVNEVIAEGFADRQPNPRHRASPLIALSPKGEAIIHQVLARERRQAERLAARFSEEEVRTALRVAETLCDEIADRRR